MMTKLTTNDMIPNCGKCYAKNKSPPRFRLCTAVWESLKAENLLNLESILKRAGVLRVPGEHFLLLDSSFDCCRVTEYSGMELLRNGFDI